MADRQPVYIILALSPCHPFVVSTHACPEKPLSEAGFGIIPGTGSGIHVDGGNATEANTTPSVASVRSADEDVSSWLMGELLGIGWGSQKAQAPF